MAIFKQNKTVLHKKKAYEIFWQTNYIEHINKNLAKATLKPSLLIFLKDSKIQRVF